MLLSSTLARGVYSRTLGVTTVLAALSLWAAPALAGYVIASVAALTAMALIGFCFLAPTPELGRLVTPMERFFWLFVGFALLFAASARWFSPGDGTGSAIRELSRMWFAFFSLCALGFGPHRAMAVDDSGREAARWLTLTGLGVLAPCLAAFLSAPTIAAASSGFSWLWAAVDFLPALGFGCLAFVAGARRWRLTYALFALGFLVLALSRLGWGLLGGGPLDLALLTGLGLAVCAASLRPSSFEIDAARKLAIADDAAVSSRSWFWLGFFMLPVFHFGAMAIDEPLVTSAHHVGMLMALLGLGCFGVAQACFYEDRRRLARDRQRDVDSLKKVRRELETKVADHTSQLSQTQVILEKEIAKSRGLEKALKVNNERYRVLVETMNDGLHVIDQHRRVTYANAALCRMLGMEVDEVEGRRLEEFFDGERLDLLRRYWERIGNGSEDPFEIAWRAKDGRLRSTIVSPRSILDRRGSFRGGFWVVTDLTRLKQAEDALQAETNTDSLTKLGNRVWFIERLGRAVARARAHGMRAAVVVINLDRFKRVNESLGHTMGDRLLRAVAERLGVLDQQVEAVARLGADEFAVAVVEQAGVAALPAVVSQIRVLFDEDVHLDGMSVPISASMGVSVFPEDGGEAGEIVKNASVALSCAKREGGGCSFYRAEMNSAALERLKLESELRLALEREEFVLWHQPKLDLRQGRVVGVEALIRWRHPDRGVVMPGQFIAMAEESGLIHEIGEWVIETACRQARVWQSQGLAGVKVAVNVSPAQFRSTDLSEKLLASLSRSGLNPSMLELEITESLAMEDAESSLATLRELHALGIRLALDDFGAGFTSLGYLRRFPIDTLKIDRCFVENAILNKTDEAIVQSVAAMGRNLGLEVIAEGIEEEEHLDLAARLGCDQVQGFLIAKPAPVEFLADEIKRLEAWVAKRDIKAIDWEKEGI